MILFAILGGLLGVAGLGLSLWGGIWLLILVFQTSILWGLSLFIPVIGTLSYIFFIISNWEQAKKPFLINLGGAVMMVFGGVLLAVGLPGTIGAPSGDDYGVDDSWDDWEDSEEVDDIFAQPTMTPTRFMPTPTVLNLSPVPTRTPIQPSPTVPPTATPLRADEARNHIGEYLSFQLDDGTTFVGRLIAIEGNTFKIERRIGGGNMVMPFDKSRIKGFGPP